MYRHQQGIAVNGTTGGNRLSFATGGTDLVRCKVYVTSTAYTFDTANDTVEIDLEASQGGSETTTYHPIDYHYIPIDGTSITLNASNQLQVLQMDIVQIQD